jgi:hypothetical protein
LSHSPFFNSNSTKENDTRQKEFENSLGNLLVAEYQVFRLRERIKNHLGTTGILESEFMFKVGNQWFRVNVSAQKQPIIKNESEKEITTHPTTGFSLSEPLSSEAEEEYLP